MKTSKLVKAHLDSWMEIYSDDDVQKQMYAAPTHSKAALWAYLNRRVFFSVLTGTRVIGGFNFYDVHDTRACFGIVIHPDYRGQGLGNEIVRRMKEQARKLGFTTLRADVYLDNAACLTVLKRSGFREFVWVETNL